MSKDYRWVSLGCGVIANQLAQALEKDNRQLYGVANRTYEKALLFAEKYKVEHVFKTYDEVFQDPLVEVVYISTPHNTHLPFILNALEHGKHVLCEKSITLNSRELDLAVKLAKKNNLILAEAMTIYHMPLYRQLNQIIESGRLGQLRLIQMNFGSYKDYDMSNRFFNKSLAGGALLDIGVYALSFVRWFMSQNPSDVQSQVVFAPSGVDEQASIILMNNVKEMATISLSLHAKQPKRGTLAFDLGYIEIYEYPRGEKAIIKYTSSSEEEVIESGHTDDALLYEVRDMETAMDQLDESMYLNYTIDVMKIMTDIRSKWNLFYPEEE